jgi:voltage-gated cation channel
LNRPISGSDFCYDIPLKLRDQKIKPISGSQETVREMDDRQLPEDAELADGNVSQTHQVPTLENMSERKKYFKQMSSGFGTQHSKDDPNDEEPFEIQHMNYFSSIDGNEPISLTESALQQQMEDGQLHHPSAHDDPDQIQYDEQYVNYQKSLLNRSPSYRKSLDRISLNSEDISVKSNRNSIIVSPPSLHQINNIILEDSNKQTSKTLSPPSLLSPPSHFASCTQQLPSTYSTSYDTTEIPVTVRKSSIEMRKHSPQLSGGGGTQRSPNKTSNSNNIINNRKSLKRLSSDQSINTNSLEQDDMMNQMNLKDELLNCDKKELFQFLNDDSNNYFSDIVGYSSALLDSDTDSLILNEHNYRRADDLMSPPLSTRDRKISNGSLKSNLSSISNTIFQVLEHRRGGSLSGSDKVYPQTSGVYVDTPPSKRHSMLSRQDSDEKEPLVKTSDFDDIINEFDSEMRSLKSQNQSLERRDTEDPDADQYPKYDSTDTVLRRPKPTSDGVTRSDVTKRRSLEKQKKIVDEEFNIGNEIRKLCEQLQNPFPESLPEGFTSSPGMRRKSDFQNSFERIKRISLIERVEEDVEDEKPRKIVSDKLPRRNISKEKVETFSLRSNLSLDKLNKSKEKNQGDFDHFSLAIGREHVKVKKSVTLRDPQVSEENSTPKKTPSKSPGKGNLILILKHLLNILFSAPHFSENIKNRPWHCLVTYVDELTVGGRRNSQGEYDDSTSFPYFGRNAIPKVPQDCFPIQCYEK